MLEVWEDPPHPQARRLKIVMMATIGHNGSRHRSILPEERATHISLTNPSSLSHTLPPAKGLSSVHPRAHASPLRPTYYLLFTPEPLLPLSHIHGSKENPPVRSSASQPRSELGSPPLSASAAVCINQHHPRFIISGNCSSPTRGEGASVAAVLAKKYEYERSACVVRGVTGVRRNAHDQGGDGHRF